MTDVFRECRERVTAEDAARHYGLTFDRRGWAVCPFHSDKRPSMSFRAGRFRCWSCGASGDSIDFTAKLFGLEPLAAVERLNIDFGLNLPIGRKPTPEELQAARRRKEIAEAHKQFEEWREALCRKLCAAYRVAHIALRDMEGLDKLTEREALAIQHQARLEYIADCLTYGSIEQQMEVFREREVIGNLCEKILHHTSTRSGAA